MKFPTFLVEISKMLNRLSCGPKGYSLCARFWEARLNGKKWGKVAVKITDTLFWFDKGHCRKSWIKRGKE